MKDESNGIRVYTAASAYLAPLRRAVAYANLPYFLSFIFTLSSAFLLYIP